MKKHGYPRSLRFFVVAISLLFLTGLVAVVVTGGYAFEVAGINFSSNSIKPPLAGFIVFALLSLALSISMSDLALLFGSILLSLVFGELSLRVLEPPQAAPALIRIHQPSAVYSYELVPGSRGVGTLGEKISINLQGTRDDEFDPDMVGPKILVVGDSFTFAMGVEVEQGFVSQSEASLRSRHAGVQVVNLGVIGYSFWQYLEVLERRAPAYSADLVIVAMFMDDLLGTVRPDSVIPRQPFAPSSDDWLSEFRLVNVVRNFITLAEAKYRGRRGVDYLASIEKRKQHLAKNSDHRYSRIQFGELGSTALSQFSGAVDNLSSWSVRNGVPILVLFIPDSSQLHEVDRQVANEIASQEFERVGVPFLDLTPDFEAIQDTKSLFLFPMDAHTSEKGHTVIANGIVNHPLVTALFAQ